MRRNGKPILSKIQDVMGIKNGKYCSSDVNVVSLNGNSAEASAFMGEDKEPSVTYTSCPSKELKTIYLKDIIMNKNIIPDCVLGGSVTLNNLGGYVVNYGETICPAPTVKLIQSCLDGKTISIDFGDNVVTDGSVYRLTFNGGTRLGCYTIIGDTPILSEDSVSSVQQVPDCLSCTPTRTYAEIQSCENGLTYSVATKESLSIGSTSYLIFNDGMIPNGCYNILGMTLSTPMDSVGLVYMTYEDCQTCQSQPQPKINTEIQSCENGLTYSVKGLKGEIKRGIFNLTFQEGMLPNGCYNVIGITTNDPVDGISTSSNNYDDCMSCLNPTPTPTITPTPK